MSLCYPGTPFNKSCSRLESLVERYELFVAVLELVRVEALLPYFRAR